MHISFNRSDPEYPDFYDNMVTSWSEWFEVIHRKAQMLDVISEDIIWKSLVP